MHPRKKIRLAVKKMLRDGNTRAGKRVFSNQSTRTWDDDKNLPVILIYPLSEDATVFNEAPRELKRIINLNVECIASGPEDELAEILKVESIDDILDAMSEEVECELSRDDTLLGTADDVNLTNTEFEFKGEGENTIGSMRLTFAVTYYRLVPVNRSKQAEIGDFKRAHIDHHIGHNDEEPDLQNKEAEDDVDIP